VREYQNARNFLQEVVWVSHYLDIVGVTGSIPVAPTSKIKGLDINGWALLLSLRVQMNVADPLGTSESLVQIHRIIPKCCGAQSTASCRMSEVEVALPPQQETPHTPARFRLWKFVWSGLGALVAGIGLWVGYVELTPAIHVDAAPSLAADDPFEPRFTITNVGYLSVYDLGFGCLVTLAMQPKVTGPLDLDLGIHDRANAEAGNNASAEAVLAPQDSVVKTCPVQAANNTPANIALVGATIDFCISYRPFPPSFLVMNGFVLNRVARFISRNNPSGGIEWISAHHPEMCPLSLPPWK
jgi:hypothetical protein